MNGESQRLLRAADWGQVFASEPGDGTPAQLIEEIMVLAPIEAALGLVDDWQALSHPSLLAVLAASVEVRASGRILRIEREAPRGSHLAEVFARARPADERMVAALLLDVARALQIGHERGLVAGVLSPESLFLCPPGLDDAPALRLHDAGLPAIVTLASGPLGDAAGARLQQLLPVTETMAPEVLAGQEPGIPADVYALSATAAFCLLGRHLYVAATPALVRHQVSRGLEPSQLAALLDVAPVLAPLLGRGLAVHPWGRAGVLAELITAFEHLVADRPSLLVGGRRIVAPWAIGSPLVPLAAYAGTQQFADRFSAKSIVAAGISTAGPRPPDADPDKTARLRVALQRLDAERVASQRRSAAQDRSVLSYVVVVVVFLLIVVAVMAIGLRQTERFEQSLNAAEDAVPGARRPVLFETLPEPQVIYETPQDR